MTGTNIGTGNYVDPNILKSRGYNLIRLVSLSNVETYAATARSLGIVVVAIVSPSQSQGYVMGNADIYQFDNERDVDESPSNYQAEATFYQRTYPNLTWITCGMATGNPNWWRDVYNLGLPGFSGFAVHPYNKTTAQARTLLKSYQAISPNLDMWVTEWARPAQEIPGFQKMLRELCVHDLWFCSDCGVPEFSEAPLILHAR